MKIPQSEESKKAISVYIKKQNYFMYGKEISATKLKNKVSKTFTKEFDHLLYEQTGNDITILFGISKTQNDWGDAALLVIPFKLASDDNKNCSKKIKTFLSQSLKIFPDIKEVTFILFPESKLIPVLTRQDFKLDATMLIGEIKKTFKIYKHKSIQMPQNLKVKNFNFNRDYPQLKKIKSRDAKLGTKDSRLDYSKKKVRLMDYEYWKGTSSKKNNHVGIGIWKDNKLVGAMALMFFDLEHDIPRLHIGDIIIDMKHRNQKLSSYLYSEAFNRASNKSVKYFTGATTTSVILKTAKKMARNAYLHVYTYKIQH